MQLEPDVIDWSPPEEFDDYILDRQLGGGAMGRVYLAEDAVLARPVAIKFLVTAGTDNAARQRFLIEARAAARIQHPNVVSIFRVGDLEGVPFLITEFVRGRILGELELPLAQEQLLLIGVGLARGLAAAHRRGVIHGDIKPGNAILSDDGVVKLFDFGLAALVEEAAAGGTAPVRPDGLAGTPDYMAPELWRGLPPDRRTDVYSLGALLYELATGRPPHWEVSAGKLPLAVQQRDVPALVGRTDLEPSLARVIDRCLAREPADRFASGEALRDVLDQIDRAGGERGGADAGGAPGQPALVPDGNPYRGLRPFEAEHRGLFFGRSAEIGLVLDRLRAEPFVLVAGDSGVGKSSLCRAGVVPAVLDGALGGRRTNAVAALVPGRRPLRALIEAVAGALELPDDEVATLLRDRAGIRALARRHLGDDRGLLVFVDQLEELVTLAEPDERDGAEQALAQLAAGGPGIALLATVRADYLARLADLEVLGDRLPAALMFLRRLGPDRIREVVVGPARAAGLEFESDELVATLVEAASDQGGLPLLQFALAELWNARDRERHLITADALTALGGVAGALSRHADAVLGQLPPGQLAAARRILTSLVTSEGTRARRDEGELSGGDAAASAALAALVRGRLLVAHEGDRGGSYELAHEALVDGWGQLRGWLIEDADRRLVLDRLHGAAGEWERLERPREALWGAGRLREVRHAGVAAGDAGLSALAAEFLQRSGRAVGRRRWLMRSLAVAVPALILAAYFGAQLQAARRRDRVVAAQLAEGRAVELQAQAEAEAGQAAAREAFARFDQRDPTGGEILWTGAVKKVRAAEQGYASAARAFELALAQDPGSGEVKSHLGRVLLERARLADRTGQDDLRDELLERLALYDHSGALRRAWSQPEPLQLVTHPGGAELTIEQYQEQPDGRLVARAVPGSPTRAPVHGWAMAPGSYLVTLRAPGRAEVRYPLLAARGGRALDLSVTLPPAAEVPAGFVYVAPGRFLFGSDADEEIRTGFFTAAPLHSRMTGGYLIGREEVTYADWIAYLEALPPSERKSRAPRVAPGVEGKSALSLEPLPGGDWQLQFRPAGRDYVARSGQPLHYQGRTRRATQDWRRFPVTGVTAYDAEAYARWLDRTGRLPGARLCSEAEWERAARGADRRTFPHGFRLAREDANHDETYDKSPGAMGPDQVGSYPASRSPFGLDDMAGNAFEWTTSVMEDGAYVARGGSFYYDTKTAEVVNRAESTPTLRDVTLGFRVCASRP